MSEGTRLKVLKDLAKASKLVSYDKSSDSGDSSDSSDEEYGVPSIYKVNYSFLPVNIPSNFLAPLPDPANTLSIRKINWKKETNIPENHGKYAVIIDNVLNESECKELIHMAEISAGAHQEGSVANSTPNNGWRTAMVSAGYNREFLDISYRNSDRIIWDNQEVIHRIWARILQGKGMKEYFSELKGEKYEEVIGKHAVRNGDRYVVSEKGPNERMRFLKYGAGQYFREHCDGMYGVPDSDYRSYYTMHVYLNDSAQALGHPINLDIEEDSPDALLEGGATTFHSDDRSRRFDADPKIGRVLIFQQQGLLHSGDEVTRGIKYTKRSDLMYRLEYDEDDDVTTEEGGWVSFGD